MKKIIFLIASILMIIIIISDNQNVRNSVITGIHICSENLIPSLLPICFVTTLIINSGAITSVNHKLSVPLFFIISQIAGYPVGAVLISSAVQENMISKKDAQRILPSMICAGPPFIISFVGELLFESKLLGIYMYAALLFSNIIIFLISKGTKVSLRKTKDFSLSDEIDKSVKKSAVTVFNICCYVILFFALKTLISNFFGEKISQILICIFEVTNGVIETSNIYIVCAVLSWGGICVMLQIKGITINIGISFYKIMIWRFISVLISCSVLRLLTYVFPIKNAVFSNLTQKPTILLGGNFSFLVFAIFSIIVMLLSLRRRTTGQFLKDII
ncbi:MAG: hypothetical protein U0M42_01350 [Acutalibacteraceae bacterium]|nr:hypothetical protein [Acutalibacteraceae bacterium]